MFYGSLLCKAIELLVLILQSAVLRTASFFYEFEIESHTELSQNSREKRCVLTRVRV